MNRSEIDQKFLDEINESRYPRMAEDRPPLRIDIAGVGKPTPPEDVGPAPDDIATQMAAGAEPEGATPMTLGEFATTVADAPAGVLKGVVQGTVGLPGDIISLVRGVYDLGASGGSLDAFLAGLEKPTGLPTTEDVKTFFDKTLGIPLVPEGASDRRMEAVKTAEFVGELGGAGTTAIAGTRAAVRSAKDIVQEMATTPPRGSVQIRPTPVQTPTPVQAPRSGLGFYSAVEETVANLPQTKGSGQQFLAQIQKTSGVKPDEIKWTGLDEFLKGKKSVTKTEIQDYLNANRVDVQEVRLGEPTPEDVRLFMEDEAGQGYDYEDALDYLRGSGDAPKFSSYTLPGGENYREILLTLPVKERVVETQVAAGKKPVIFENKTTGQFELLDSMGEPRAFLNTRAEAEKAADEIAAPFVKSETVRDPEFYSLHFDQPNVLAHMRVNDRTVDGKKTLFIEEIQSDWHQAGRKKGYQSKDIESQLKVSEERMKKRGQEIRGLSNRMAALDDTQLDEFNALAAERQRLLNLQNEETDLGNRLYDARREGVLDAPFKTSWHELTLKRAIQEASEKGYDQIAFTTGKTQAERYDLSKQIDEINVVGRTNAVTGEKSKSVALDTVDGQSIRLGVAPDGTVDNVNDQNMNNLIGKSLDEVVGKELAKKIMEGGSQTISGEGLKVGGEGMTGFYDNILPKSLEKLGKKFDAKVGKTEMDGVEVWQMDITPKMRESVTTKGQPLFAVPAAGLLGAGMSQDEQMY